VNEESDEVYSRKFDDVYQQLIDNDAETVSCYTCHGNNPGNGTKAKENLTVTHGYITLALFGYSARIFLTNAFAFCSAGDLATTLAKGVVFGVLISATGCRCGLETGAGSDAVGKATTSAVVTSLVLFIAADGLFALVSSAIAA
jgi:hypothetical protein